jgi:hypothetical protein
MEWRDFIASLIDSIAWPVAVIVLVVLLRTQIRGLFDGTLQRLNLGLSGAEFEWAQVERATAVAVASNVRAASSCDGGPSTDHQSDRLEASLAAVDPLVAAAPGVAIRRAFDIIEEELRRIVDEHQLELPYPDPDVYGYIKAAHHGQAITKSDAEALRGMAVLRNLTGDDGMASSTTPEKARDFVNLTRALLCTLR